MIDRAQSVEDEVITADVAVIGAGPAGIAAAVRAAESGLSVVVLHEGAEPGGQIWRHVSGATLPRVAELWLARLTASSARVIGDTSVVDARARGRETTFVLTCERDGQPLSVQATSVVLATGARELFLPFPGWTLPGVVGVGGAQALCKSGASFEGRRVVIAGSGPLLLPVAATLARAGARVAIVAEQADGAAVRRFASGLWRTPELLVQAARYRAAFARTPYRTGTWITQAHGGEKVESVTLTNGRRSWDERADVVCTGFGLVPNTEIARLLGCETRAGAVLVDEVQGTRVRGVYAAGEVTGVGGATLAIVEGEIAGLVAARRANVIAPLRRTRDALHASADRMRKAFAPRAELRTLPTPDTMICRCEDVPYGSVRSASCARQAKLYTRAGMGACQGRVCGAALQYLLGWDADTIRTPLEPTLVSVLSSDVVSPGAASSSHLSAAGDPTR